MSRDAGAAAVMSFIIPGLGQIYNGEILKGICGFIVCLVLYLTIFLGLIVHAVLIADAYSTAMHGPIPNQRRPWYRRHYYLPGDPQNTNVKATDHWLKWKYFSPRYRRGSDAP